MARYNTVPAEPVVVPIELVSSAVLASLSRISGE